ncbi:alpha-mannosidase [Halothermothrix orenii]|nr:glycoside hydrolase family 38 C-terminal domain-containing protein [Halothermothrix orenii]
MPEVTNAHIISHTHWDREWFLNSKYTNEWLVPFFDSLFDMLEKEEDYRFILDGQTLMVEDYLAELEKQGKNSSKYKEKLKKYVKKGQIIIGPYYLQPDWQLLSEESLVRNLLIGHKVGNELGGVMKTGWLLDNFGQISQAPQIHKLFGLKGLFLWRGVEMPPTDIDSEFMWKSPDGTEMVSVYFLSSYRNAMRLAEYKEMFKERIENEVNKISPFATTSNVLLMNGYDQEMIPDNILPELENLSLEGIRAKQSTPPEYIDAISKENPDLKVLEGALYSGRYISVFPGILSARMYLKLKNDRCQRELTNYAEPLSALSWLMGGNYEDDTFLEAWKTLLKNHPHDSICGVSIDDVHTDMEERLARAYSISRRLTERGVEELTLNIKTEIKDDEKQPFVVFNTFPSGRGGVVSLDSTGDNCIVTDSTGKALPTQKGTGGNHYVYLDDIPATGYKTIYLDEGSDSFNAANYTGDYDRLVVKDNWIENKYLAIEIESDGSLNVFDKVNQEHYSGLGVFVDDADAGDTYNYSYPENDLKITTRNQKADIEIVEAGPLVATIKISQVMKLPASLSEDRKTRSEELLDLPVVNWVKVKANSPRIEFKTEVKNTVKDHRLRVLFPTGIDSKYSYAGTQFDITRHEIYPGVSDDSEIPDNVKRIIIGARESEPITTFPQCYFVDINDGDKGVAVLNKGLPEYEILPEDNIIALTLFRSVGWLARGDLLTRVGDAGPVIYTPDAQCLREMTFEYSLYFHKGDCLQGEVYHQARDYNNELLVIKTEQHEGVLPPENYFIKLHSPDNALQVTAIKRSEDGEGLILRLFNTGDKEVSGTLTTSLDCSKAYYANLNEEVEEKISIDRSNELSINVKPREIKTIKMVLESSNILDTGRAGETEIIENRSAQTDFSQYKSLPIVEKEDIEKEKIRLQRVEEKLNQSMKRVESLKNKLDKATNLSLVELAELEAEYHQARGDVTSYRRAALEARLSVVLTRKKYLTLYRKDEEGYKEAMDKIDEELREIGYALNQARVDKRVYEYIVEYYQHRLKLAKESCLTESGHLS